jgi:hypothetical protein
MKERIEIANLATQLTIAILASKDSEADRLVYRAQVAGADKELPKALVIFDEVFAHIQSTLMVQ